MLQTNELSRDDLIALLASEDAGALEQLRSQAEAVLLANCGPGVNLRGLIEFSNICICDCLYCGIRKSNKAVERYSLSTEEIIATARWCAEAGYGSVVLQSGERNDARFIDGLVSTVAAIKAATQSETLPDGLGITLSVGEQSYADYERLFEAGAHRYLLRMETSSRELFALLHPELQSYDVRLACLGALKAIGYQVGTGVMIGLPGQTLADLADDLLFFREFDVDMIGMGPYIPHAQAALGASDILSVARRLQLTLKMIAAARLLLPLSNIAATTALQALTHDGREQGLRFGANVIMPQATPLSVRGQYTLYDGKPCLEDSAGQCAACLQGRIVAAGRYVTHNQWGDSAHFSQRMALTEHTRWS